MSYFIDNCHEIVPNLFLGNYLVANDLEYLKVLGITHIINCSVEHPNYFSNNFNYLYLPLHDDTSENIFIYFNKSFEFIRDCHKKNGKVLVHCHAGVSRSSTIVIAYLMKKYKKPFYKTLKYIQSIRGVVNPNEGFRLQLECYEECKNDE